MWCWTVLFSTLLTKQLNDVSLLSVNASWLYFLLPEVPSKIFVHIDHDFLQPSFNNWGIIPRSTWEIMSESSLLDFIRVCDENFGETRSTLAKEE
jgi:hypothetical protein